MGGGSELPLGRKNVSSKEGGWEVNSLSEEEFTSCLTSSLASVVAVSHDSTGEGIRGTPK